MRIANIRIPFIASSATVAVPSDVTPNKRVTGCKIANIVLIDYHIDTHPELSVWKFLQLLKKCFIPPGADRKRKPLRPQRKKSANDNVRKMMENEIRSRTRRGTGPFLVGRAGEGMYN